MRISIQIYMYIILQQTWGLSCFLVFFRLSESEFLFTTRVEVSFCIGVSITCSGAMQICLHGIIFNYSGASYIDSLSPLVRFASSATRFPSHRFSRSSPPHSFHAPFNQSLVSCPSLSLPISLSLSRSLLASLPKSYFLMIQAGYEFHFDSFRLLRLICARNGTFCIGKTN